MVCMPVMEKLNPAEFQALRHIAQGRAVETPIKHKLRDMGLIEEFMGGWLLTNLGKLHLAAGPG